MAALSSPERKEIIFELLESYESEGADHKVIDLIEKTLKEDDERKIKLSPTERNDLLEKLAFHYAWTDQTLKSFEILKSLNFNTLSPNAKALFVIHSYYLGMISLSQESVNRLTPQERKRMTNDYRNLLDQVENDLRLRRESIHIYRTTLDNPLSQDDLHFSPLDPMESRAWVASWEEKGILSDPSYLSVSEMTGKHQWPNPSMRFVGEFLWVRTENHPFRLMGGVEKDWSPFALKLKLGGLTGDYFNTQGRVELSYSDLRFLDYMNFTFDLAEPVVYSDTFVDHSISETRLALYVEKSFGSFLETYSEVIGKLGHRKRLFHQGHGFQFSHRSMMSLGQRYFWLGPSVYLSEFRTDDSTLRNFFGRRVSIFGASIEARWWPGKVSDWKLSARPALGYDAHQSGSDALALSAECQVEKALGASLGLLFVYSYYSSGASKLGLNAAHTLSLKLLFGKNGEQATQTFSDRW